MYTSIIFDLDGTLLDTLVGIAATCNRVLDESGFPLFPTENYRCFVGDGLTALIERITPKGTSKKIIDECCGRFRELYVHNWRKSCAPYPGIGEMLAALQERAFRLAVLSNKPHAFTTTIVDESFSKGIFSRVYGQRDGYAKKPDPTVALTIAAEFGAIPQETIMVGDSGVDIRTGKAAGMLAVGVTWGFRDKEELMKNQSDIIIDSPLELLHHVVSSS